MPPRQEMVFSWGIKATKSKEQILRTRRGKPHTLEFERHLEPCTHLDASIGRLEQSGLWIESALVRKLWAGIVLLALAFLSCTSVRALYCPLRFDEILTEYIAALPSFSAICRALAAHAESTPPLFHLVTKLSCITVGWNSLGLRFPAIAGYFTMMLCVYFVVRRYAGSLYAAIGALSSYMTNAPYFSTEARPYGLLLGLSCISLVCWQLAARHRNRRLTLAGLWLSQATAFGLHYYAVLSFAAIGLGELVRTWRRRQIDWPVWGALGFATAPLPFLLPLIRSNLILKTGYFSHATFYSFVYGIEEIYLPERGIVLVTFAVVIGTCVVVFSGRQAQAPMPLDIPAVHEVAAWVVLLLAPVEAFIMGRYVTGVFVPRYTIVTIIGFSILFPLCLRQLFRGSKGAALVAAFSLALCFGGQHAVLSRREDFNTGLVPWLRASAHSRSPILVADPLTYLRLAHLEDKGLAAAFVYIPDPQEALKYTRINTADYNLSGLRGITPLNLPTYSSFASSHDHFLLLWQPSPFDWIVSKLRDSGAELRFCSQSGSRVLFLVDLPAIPISTGDR